MRTVVITGFVLILFSALYLKDLVFKPFRATFLNDRNVLSQKFGNTKKEKLDNLVTLTLGIPCIKKDIPALENMKISIRKQTIQPDEVILVVSGVKEEECPAIENWIVICHDKLMYAGPARNDVWAKATSDIVSFIDADDQLYPERIEIIKKYFSNNKELLLLIHQFSKESIFSHARINYPVAKFMDGHGIYTQTKATQASHPWIEAKMHHGHVSFRKNIKCDKYPNVGDKAEDSYFLRKCVYSIGDEKDKMIYIRAPLSRYVPREHRGFYFNDWWSFGKFWRN